MKSKQTLENCGVRQVDGWQNRQARVVAPPARIAPKPLPIAAVDSIVDELREISRSATLDLALRIGELIVRRFYNGDVNDWRRRGAKNISFRRLADHPLLPMSPGALYRAVATYELFRRVNQPKQLQHLSCSHFRAVLGVSNTEQLRLLHTAERERWTVQRIEHEAACVRQTGSPRGGRRPTPPALRCARAIRRCLDRETERLLSALVEPLPPGQEEELSGLAMSLKQTTARLEQAMRREGLEVSKRAEPPTRRDEGPEAAPEGELE